MVQWKWSIDNVPKVAGDKDAGTDALPFGKVIANQIKALKRLKSVIKRNVSGTVQFQNVGSALSISIPTTTISQTGVSSFANFTTTLSTNVATALNRGFNFVKVPRVDFNASAASQNYLNNVSLFVSVLADTSAIATAGLSVTGTALTSVGGTGFLAAQTIQATFYDVASIVLNGGAKFYFYNSQSGSATVNVNSFNFGATMTAALQVNQLEDVMI